jgi:hypothetical protein
MPVPLCPLSTASSRVTRRPTKTSSLTGVRGHRQRLSDETEEEWDSFSAFTDLTKVRQTAAFLKQRRRLPSLYVARLDIPNDAPIELFPYRGSRIHFGVRGDPALLRGFATIVARV